MSAILALLTLAAGIPEAAPANPWFQAGWRSLLRSDRIAASLGEGRGADLRLREIPVPEAVVFVDAARADAEYAQTQAQRAGADVRRLVLRDPGRRFGPPPGVVPPPAWMDPSVTIVGGNVVARSYPIGWGF